jgi:hypothetical protein
MPFDITTWVWVLAAGTAVVAGGITIGWFWMVNKADYPVDAYDGH